MEPANCYTNLKVTPIREELGFFARWKNLASAGRINGRAFGVCPEAAARDRTQRADIQGMRFIPAEVLAGHWNDIRFFTIPDEMNRLEGINTSFLQSVFSSEAQLNAASASYDYTIDYGMCAKKMRRKLVGHDGGVRTLFCRMKPCPCQPHVRVWVWRPEVSVSFGRS